MATHLRQKADRPPTSSMPAPEPLHVPRTPLESRQGYHPKTVSLQYQPLPLSAFAIRLSSVVVAKKY